MDNQNTSVTQAETQVPEVEEVVWYPLKEKKSYYGDNTITYLGLLRRAVTKRSSSPLFLYQAQKLHTQIGCPLSHNWWSRYGGVVTEFIVDQNMDACSYIATTLLENPESAESLGMGMELGRSLSTPIKNPVETIYNISAKMEQQLKSVSEAHTGIVAQMEKAAIQLSEFPRAAADAKAAYESVALTLNKLDFVSTRPREYIDAIILPTDASSSTEGKTVHSIQAHDEGTYSSYYSIRILKGLVTSVEVRKGLADMHWLGHLNTQALMIALNYDQEVLMNNISANPHLAFQVKSPDKEKWKSALRKICKNARKKFNQWKLISNNSNSHSHDDTDGLA
ncbi:uncharacterized protein LOC144477203 [Augochlora pura]